MPMIQSGSLPSVAVKIDPKIGIGLGTIAGILFAVAQYLGAVGTMLAGDLTPETISLFATATFTLVTTLVGRYKQASDAIKAIGQERAANPVAVLSETTPETNVLYLDGKAIAEAVVKRLNTNAILADMQTRQSPPAEPVAVATGGE